MKMAKQNFQSSTLEIANIDSSNFNYSISYKIAEERKKKNVCNGDSFKCEFLERNQFIILLSDGMGSGVNANHRSNKAINMISKMLKMGFSICKTMKFANKLLMTNNCREIFVTLDLIWIDFNNLTYRFVKAGCYSSYIIRKNGDIITIRNKSLPLGIISRTFFNNHTLKMEDGDIIIACTDGVENPQNPWLLEYCSKNHAAHDANNLENLLLEKAKRVNKQRDDDMTIIVAKVQKTNELNY